MHPLPTTRLAALVAGFVTLAGLSAVSPVSATAVADPVVLSGYSATRTDGDWGLTEPYLSQTRGYLTNLSNFGPSGTVEATYSISPTGVNTATAASLAGVDVFFTGWVQTGSYTAAEKTALRDFVLGGGTLIATTDDTAHTMVDVFGLTQGNGGSSANTLTNATHPIIDGPFVPVATTYTQYGTIGHYAGLGPDAVEIGRNSHGTTIAVIERGDLGPGAGAVIFVADVDVFSNAYAGATTNAALIKNIFAFAVRPNTAPEVAADDADVTVDEGSAASTTGTFSDLDGDAVTLSASIGTVAPSGSGTWSWSHTPTDGPTDSQTVTITADDGALTSTATFDLTVTNVAPSVTSASAGTGTVLTGAPVTFTAAATDPSGPDTTAGFSWSFAGGSYGTSNTFTTQFASCGVHDVTVLAQDKDGGISSPFTSAEVVVVESDFLAPLRPGTFNKVKGGQVIPVKIGAGCGGVVNTGLSPAIQLLSGDIDPSTDPGDGSFDVATDSVSSADTSGIMRLADGQYLYNLRVPTGAAGSKYTVRVRPTGSAAGGTLYIVLQLR